MMSLPSSPILLSTAPSSESDSPKPLTPGDRCLSKQEVERLVADNKALHLENRHLKLVLTKVCGYKVMLK